MEKTSDGVVDNCAVCLYFDAATESVVSQAWAALADAGLSSTMPDVGWRPHITLSGCRELHLKDYLPALQKFAAQISHYKSSWQAQAFSQLAKLA